jgi:hypothetical protein
VEVRLVPSSAIPERVAINRSSLRVTPLPIHAVATTDDYDIEFTVDAVGDGPPECRSITVRARDDGAPITTTGMRVPLAKLVVTAVDLASMPMMDAFARGESEWLDRIADAMPAVDRHLITDEELPTVALLAKTFGRRAAGAVAVEFGVKRRTAFRAIQRARDAGLITEEDER